MAMGSPEYSTYYATLSRAAELTAADRAASDLHRYLITFERAQFDRLVDRAARDEFSPRLAVLGGRPGRGLPPGHVVAWALR